SLAAGANPNMPPGAHTPGDVFRTGFVAAPGGITIYATAALLGLDPNDVVDALDIGGVWGGGGGGGGGGKKVLTREEALFASHGVVPPQCQATLGSQCLNSDRDGDNVPDDADNAPFDVNPLQEDADGDDVGDVADDCPNVPNRDQLDTDGDHVGDACDPCSQIYGPSPVLSYTYRGPAVPIPDNDPIGATATLN